MVEYYALVYENAKMRPAETVPGMGGDKGEWWRGNSSMIYRKNLINATVNPQHNASQIFKYIK
jgi:hypothetical protein